MNARDSAPCELLPWDTEFFRCRIARVCGDTLKPEQTAQIDDWSRNHRIRCLYFLSRVDNPVTIQTTAQAGFGLVDIRVTFERVTMDSRDSARPDAFDGVRIRPVQIGDLPRLQEMARKGHKDTRFFSDPHFQRQRAEDLYATWITSEVQGRAQAVLVAASADNQPLGYVSCHRDPVRREGQIGLLSVSPEARGKGVGKNLVQAALGWFKAQGTPGITVVTQGSNRAAQRLYQRCGFLSRDLQLWYHKWYPISD